MSETENKENIDDRWMERVRQIFSDEGFAIVNDYEMAEIGDADEEVILNPPANISLTVLDSNYPQSNVNELLSNLEKYLNGSGYSIVSQSSNKVEEADDVSHTTMNYFMPEMALIRTISSALSMLISTIVLYKVW